MNTHVMILPLKIPQLWTCPQTSCSNFKRYISISIFSHVRPTSCILSFSLSLSLSLSLFLSLYHPSLFCSFLPSFLIELFWTLQIRVSIWILKTWVAHLSRALNNNKCILMNIRYDWSMMSLYGKLWIF